MVDLDIRVKLFSSAEKAHVLGTQCSQNISCCSRLLWLMLFIRFRAASSLEGDPLCSSLRKEWSVRKETTIKLSFRRTSAILIENITGDITTSLRKGGGVTSLSHKKHHRSENLEKENKKSSRTSLFIFFTIGI